MRVISRKRLRDFLEVHPECESALLSWYRLMKSSRFPGPQELRRTFNQVDYVKPLFVFNIGSACRLIAAIHFDREIVYVRHVLTHAEYDRGEWKRS